ncbi:hypothetical protein D9M69_621520 [compost metagenome]
MGGGGDHVGVGQRVRVQTSGDQASNVGHVDKEVGTDLVRDSTKTLEIDHSRVSRETGDDHLRLMLKGQAFDFCIIDQAVGIDTVLHSVVQLA